MFTNDTNGPDCWKCALKVEWHDCSWCPVIELRQGIAIRNRTAIKPLPTAALLAHPARRKNLFKPMKKPLSTVRRFRAGFTLIELLVVIAIIAILAAMLLPVLAAVKKHALIVKARTEISGLVTALEAYDQAYGRFPVSHAAQDAATQNAQLPGQNPDFTYGGNFGGSQGQVGTLVNGSILTNNEVIAILMDYTTYPGGSVPTINANHQSNPKQTKFLNVIPSGWAAGDPGSPLPGVGNDLVYRDPWGNPYVISMDLNYDDLCRDDLYSKKKVSQNPPDGNSTIGFFGLASPGFGLQQGQNNFQFHGKIMVWSAGPDGKVDQNTPANSGVNKDNLLSWH